MIAWDTETRSLRWWENPAFMASWSTDGEHGHVAVLPTHAEEGRLAPANVDEFLAALLADKHHAGANSKFDAHMGHQALGVDILTNHSGFDVEDVLMMSRLVYGARRFVHGLKELGVDYIDPSAADAEKDMQEKYHKLTGRTSMAYDDAYYITWRAFPDEVERYAGDDATTTYKLYDFLLPQLKADPKLWELYKLEKKVQTVLYDAERVGVRVDPEAVERLQAHYVERELASRTVLQHELGFVPEGEGSEDRLREALPKVGVPLTQRTEKTGELAVNRQALEPFVGNPVVDALFEFRRTNKFLKNYISPLQGVEEVHATFKQAEAWTGRMSAVQPNLQNLPKRTEVGKDENLKVRSVFVPREGFEFLIADYDSIEMRYLAYYVGDPGYQKLVAEGDPHSWTAAAAWPQLGNADQFLKSGPNRWLRDIAKQGTYAIAYGAGGPKLMTTFNKYITDAMHPEFLVDLEQARAIRRRIIDSIPGFKALTDSPYRGKRYPQGALYRQLAKSLVNAKGQHITEEQGYELMAAGETVFGYVRTRGGRKQWINFDRAYVALSGTIQGSAADAMKAAAVAVRDAMEPFGGTPLLFVHDEILVEIPLGWGERAKPVLVDAMQNATIIYPPLLVEAHVTDKSYAHTD